MNKSKSMAVAAAALAMCMAGSAFAQDPRFDRGPDRNDDRHDRYEQQYPRQGGAPNNGHYQQRHPKDFSLKAFHEKALGEGAVPLATLDKLLR